MISVYSPKFVLGLVTGITSITFIALGVVFSIVFGTFGLIFLAIGLLDAAVAAFVLLGGRKRRASDEAARISHGTAQIVSADQQLHVRVNDRHPVKLTVNLAGGQYTQSLLAPAHITWQPGEPVDVRYAPDNPANFVPIA
ncbi:hypothetical protein OJ998_08775 [Solirubrobacter taibaiensis]|nr:hypothetical protein [Solirubrobacter taibaiensis]